MTVNPSNTFEFPVSTIVPMAYRKAGLLSPYEELDETRAGVGREELEMLVDALATEGRVAKVQQFRTVTLTAGTYKYDLGTDVLHTIGSGMYIEPGEDVDAATSETRIEPMTLEEWQERSSKGIQSRPTSFLPYRGGSVVQAWFWPTPNEAGTVRFRCQVLRGNMTEGQYTPQFERYWTRALVYALAYELSTSSTLSMGRIQQLKMEAAEAVSKAMGHAKEQTSFQMQFSHPTPWSR